MQKKVFSLLLTSAFCIGAYSQNISFETSEGYVLGDLNNQQNWTYWGGLSPDTGMVINTASTSGSNSVYVSSNDTTEDCGIRRNITGFNRTEYSFDYKIDDVDGSDYFMIIRDNNDNIVAAFVIDYSDGNLSIYDGTIDDTSNTSTDITPNVWYNFKIVIDMTAKTAAYFVNNVSVGTKNFLPSITSVNIIDFAYDDYGTGFTVDNIKLLNADLLSTSDVKNSNEQLSIYPNPVSDFIHIKTQDTIRSVEITDAAGRLVLKDSSGRSQLSVAALQQGLYLVKVYTAGSIFTKKFIKK